MAKNRTNRKLIAHHSDACRVSAIDLYIHGDVDIDTNKDKHTSELGYGYKTIPVSKLKHTNKCDKLPHIKQKHIN